ncbi:sugar ABC transporter permease [Mycoplasma sp. 5370]
MKKNNIEITKIKEKTVKITKIFLLILPLLILLFLFYIYPIIKSTYESFIVFPSSTKKTIFIYGLNNFNNVINDFNFKIAIENSTFLFFIPTFISLFLSIFIAYMLSTISMKKTQNLFLKLIYSQFFISYFAVGIAFLLLFGEQNLFFKIFNSNASFTHGNNKLNIKLYLFIFQVWRSLSFNIVIFTFIFISINKKYHKVMILDNLNFWDKMKYLYFKEFQKHLLIIIYTNLVFSALLYPGAIMEEDKIEELQAHTLSSYVLSLIQPINGTLEIDINKAYAASILSLFYLLFLFLITYIFFFLVRFFFIKIKKGEKYD